MAEEVEKPAFGVRRQNVAFYYWERGRPARTVGSSTLSSRVKTQTKDAGGGARAPSIKRCALPAHSKRKRDECASSLVPHNVTKQVIRIQPLRDETLVTLIFFAYRLVTALTKLSRTTTQAARVGPFENRVYHLAVRVDPS